MLTTKDVLELIEQLNKESGYKNPVHEFTHGRCFIFALMLKEHLPLGSILYLPKYYHFVFRYNGHCYDATGNVTNKYCHTKHMSLAEFIRRQKLTKMFQMA